MGFIPLMKGCENFAWISMVSVSWGATGIIVLLLFGLDRAIEVSDDFRIRWINIRTE